MTYSGMMESVNGLQNCFVASFNDGAGRTIAVTLGYTHRV